MRPALAIATWVFLVGGLALYMEQRPEAKAVETYQPEMVEAEYTLEITTSFSAEVDPFALDVGDDEAVALRVLLNGAPVLTRSDGVKAGKPIRSGPLPGLLATANEFYVEAYPPSDAVQRANAVRLRLLRGDTTIAEDTFWSAPGMPVSGTWTVTPTQAPTE